MSASAGTGVFVLSLMSIPICYLFNSLVYNNSAEAFFFAGCATFIFLVISARFILRRKAPLDSLFYVYAVHAFFSVVNLIIGLEQDNIIDGFVTFYLKEADPHINTAHGHMMSYWDGCVHYLMYLLMIAAITWGDNFRAIGLYWVGSFVMRSIIYLLGNAVGKYGTEMGPLFFLHLLYIAVSVWACFRIFSHPSTRTVELTSIQEAQKMTLFRRPMDLFFIIYLIPAMSFCVFRGLVALDCSNALCQHYVQHYEPYVKDPSAYPKIHDLFFTNHAVEGLLLLSLTKLFERAFKQSQEKCTWMAALKLSIDKISIQRMPWKVIKFYPSGLQDVHKFQMLVSMLYSGPYYIMTLYSLLVPGCEWMLDLTLVHSGAVAQAQFSHIGASLHTRTPFSYRVPVANQPVFLLVNILYAVVPQALCYRCTTRPAFFLKGMPDKKNA